jgi:hypothetical protein
MAAQGDSDTTDRAGVVTPLLRAVPSSAGEGDARPARPGVAYGVRSTRVGARFDPLLPFETWKGLGSRFGLYANASAWWLGDWLAFGRMKYGRRYKEAIAVTGLDYQTLRNYAMVARRFEPSRRRDNLTFQHHAAVCALPDAEQDRWLDAAAAGKWSRNELRRQMRGPTDEHADTIFRVAVAERQAERWRLAAQRSRCAFEAWMVSVLDAAAAAAVGD